VALSPRISGGSSKLPSLYKTVEPISAGPLDPLDPSLLSLILISPWPEPSSKRDYFVTLLSRNFLLFEPQVDPLVPVLLFPRSWNDLKPTYSSLSFHTMVVQEQ